MMTIWACNWSIHDLGHNTEVSIVNEYSQDGVDISFPVRMTRVIWKEWLVVVTMFLFSKPYLVMVPIYK